MANIQKVNVMKDRIDVGMMLYAVDVFIILMLLL